MLPQSNSTLYLIATDVGVFANEDWGKTWIELADGLPNTVAMHLDYNKTTREIFIGTHGRGIYKTNLLFKLNVSVLIEGFYNSNTNTMVSDTVTVYLAKANSPYAKVDSSKIFLNSAGTGAAYFAKAVRDSIYYLVIKHRNSIETWSASGQTFNSFDMTYDFTNAQNKAYGNNLVQMGSKWCIYSGEIANGDQYIDGNDVSAAFNAQGISGYIIQDVTGDNYVDADDVSLTFNNQGVGAITPNAKSGTIPEINDLRKEN